MTTLEAKAKRMLESTLSRLAELRDKATEDPDDQHLWLDVVLEEARCETLRVLISHADDHDCHGIDRQPIDDRLCSSTNGTLRVP